MLGLSIVVLLLAALAVYPDGAYQRRYELRLVYGAAALVVVVPLLALLARPTLMPAAIFEWIAGSREAADQIFPPIASPIHVEALAFLEAPVRFFLSIAFTLRSRSGPASSSPCATAASAPSAACSCAGRCTAAWRRS